MKLHISIYHLFFPFLLLLVLPGSFSAVEEDYDCTWSDEFSLHNSGTVFVQEYVNRDEGTVSMRIRYTGGESWIGVGINYMDDTYMAPAYAVIGRIDNGGSSVRRYWIDSAGEDGITPIGDPNMHLKRASFLQQDGETILEFTHDLTIIEDGAVMKEITADSKWIWAVGPDGNDWGGRHELQGAFTGELSENCKRKEPTDAPTSASVLDENEKQESSMLDRNETASDPSTAATSALIKSESESSKNLWIVHGLFMGFAWGLCAPIAIGASLFRNSLSKGDLWFHLHLYLNVAVAVLTFMGFFIAVAALNREGDVRHFQDDTHQKAGLAIFLFVLFQCLLGCFRPSKALESNKRTKPTITESHHGEQKDQQKDQEQGFEVEVANITAMTEDSDGDNDNNNVDNEDDDDDDTWSVFTPPPPPATLPPPEEGEGQEAVANTSATKPVSSTPRIDPTMARTYWKYLHRLLGVILLCLAWSNCQSGIVLFSEKYTDTNEEQLLNVFWGFTGTIAVLILLKGYVLRD
jgi:hypothetical protein